MSGGDLTARVCELARLFEERSRERIRRTAANIAADAEQFKAFTAVSVTWGPRYARLVQNGAACGFVDLQTGGILFASSWKGPKDKRPRGSVWAEDYGLSAFGPYGVASLR